MHKKCRYFHKNIRFCVENICTARASIKKNIGEQKLKWLKLSVKIQRLGFEFPSGRDIFCLKNSDTSTRTSVRVSEMNAAARAQLTWL